MAVILPSAVAPMRMRWIVAGRWVVLLMISGRGSATFTGRFAARAPSAASSASARRNNLPPKPPPMNGDIRRTFSLAMPSVFAMSLVPQSIIWFEVQTRELVAVPGRDRGVRLHHRVRLIGRRVGCVELDRRCGEGAGEIARRRVGRAAETRLVLDRGVLRRRKIERAVGRRIIDADELRGRARLLEGFGDDERDGLVIMLDLGAAEQLGGVVVALAELAGVLRRDDRQHAGRRLGVFQIDRRDAALGDGCADHIAVGLVGDDIVPLIGVGRGARGLERTVDAVGRPGRSP